MRSPSSSREVSCLICGSKFMTRHSQGKYCSEKCQHEGMKKSYKKYGRKNREKRRKFQREWYLKNRKKRIDQTRKYQLTKKGKEVIRLAGINQRKNHPEKQKAREEVRKATKKGIISKLPCEVCGEKNTQAHHDDYSKPLQINWLCKKHHLEKHNRKEF